MGSLGFAVKEAGLGGVSARTRVHTPKPGFRSPKFPKERHNGGVA